MSIKDKKLKILEKQNNVFVCVIHFNLLKNFVIKIDF
jgi:ribosomal protein L25 (general stress protein Ctc)